MNQEERFENVMMWCVLIAVFVVITLTGMIYYHNNYHYVPKWGHHVILDPNGNAVGRIR